MRVLMSLIGIMTCCSARRSLVTYLYLSKVRMTERKAGVAEMVEAIRLRIGSDGNPRGRSARVKGQEAEELASINERSAGVRAEILRIDWQDSEGGGRQGRSPKCRQGVVLQEQARIRHNNVQKRRAGRGLRCAWSNCLEELEKRG
jgi:hypothetical protein